MLSLLPSFDVHVYIPTIPVLQPAHHNVAAPTVQYLLPPQRPHQRYHPLLHGLSSLLPCNVLLLNKLLSAMRSSSALHDPGHLGPSRSLASLLMTQGAHIYSTVLSPLQFGANVFVLGLLYRPGAALRSMGRRRRGSSNQREENSLCSCRQTTGGNGIISNSRFILRPYASLSVPQREATHEQAAPVTATSCTHTLSHALQTALVV